MRTQFYMPADWFALKGTTRPPGISYPGESGIFENDTLLLGGMALLIIIFFVIMVSKHRSMITAHKGLDEVRWDKLNWTPPKLVLSSFRKPGKICKSLTPLEAAFYLGLPLKRILSSILRESPLQVKVLSQPDLSRLDPYERHFFNSLADDGQLSQEELESLMNLAVKNIQEKAWDCDLEATRKHYQKEFARQFRKARSEATAFWEGEEEIACTGAKI